MGEKSVQKKRYIVEKAREVFVEKGFKKVTMKDIVEACDISRGGLYLYFENTSQIFMEVLRMESEEAAAAAQERMNARRDYIQSQPDAEPLENEDDYPAGSFGYSSSVFKGAEERASAQEEYTDAGYL